MSSSGSVSAWIIRLKAGEEAALDKLHRRYWPVLVGLARSKLKDTPARFADEEDIAQQAFWAFYQGIKAGRLPRLANRHDFLALLTHIIACEAVNQVEYDTAQKRGGNSRGRLTLEELASIPDGERTPMEQALVCDCYHHYLDRLPRALHQVAEPYLAGFTNREIAARLGCVERTVERKIARILARWQELAAIEILGEKRAAAEGA
jgi:RNA polymerase sigma factor (sigma-70 family)